MQDKQRNIDDISADERMKEVAKILALAIKRKFAQPSDPNKESLKSS